MIKWGRKGLFAGAFAFTFVTSPVTTNNVQAHVLTTQIPGQFQYYHITAPSGVTGLQAYYYLDSITRFEFKTVTGSGVAPPYEPKQVRYFFASVGTLMR